MFPDNLYLRPFLLNADTTDIDLCYALTVWDELRWGWSEIERDGASLANARRDNHAKNSLSK